MTDKIEVTQVHRNAASDWYRDCMDQEHIACEIERGENDNMLVQAFARFERDILATRTDATPVAEVAELRGNISIMEAALQQIAGTHAERFGMCQTDVEEVPDLSAEEAVSIARNALEAAGDTHPPATDVTALVEAAREVSDRAFMTYRRNGRDHYIEDDSGEGCMIVPHDAWNALRQALAPFTKGQNDE